MRQLIYYISLSALIILANTGDLEAILDAWLGIKWAAPIVEFIIKNNQGLVIILLVSIYFDYVKGGHKSNIQLHKKIDNIYSKINDDAKVKFKDRYAKKKFINQLLIEEYGENKSINNLTSTILSDKPIYENVVVHYTLKDLNRDQFYLFNYNIQFDALINKFIIGFVYSSDLQDKLSASANAISDIFTFSNKNFMEENLKKMLKEKTTLKYFKGLEDGTNQYVSCPFELIPKEDYRKYIDGSLSEKYDEIILVQARVGDKIKKRITLSHEFIMRKDDHYCYWVADRPMYVGQVVFDCTKFFNLSTNKICISSFYGKYFRNEYHKRE